MLAPGTHIGPYEVTAQIGVGGMGEVYRAQDTKLKRQVAVKVLPESVAQDADRLARFQREAEVLAQLNHPNIAAIHGLEESDGLKALVMELVEGPTLADRIAEGPVPVDEALPIAKQIAEALEAAHEQGIIHRDLKPANIKVRPDGTVKVLDFGLAKAMEPAGASAQANVSQLPTITTPAMTMAGMILGTAAYMSPEQARGRPVDKRADIWAFGCVLYEMLTGMRAFEGEDVAETLANVINREPVWERLPVGTPSALQTLLRRSVKKDPRERLRDIGEARILVTESPSGDPSLLVAAAAAPPTGGWRRVVPWAVAVAAVAAAVSTWVTRPNEVPRPSLRLSADLGADATLRLTGGASAVLSPDDGVLAFIAQPSTSDTSLLYVRRLDALEATPLRGTEGATDPFFSPDGRTIAFFADGKLKKIDILGGTPIALCDAPNARGGTWADDDTIVFNPRAGAGVSLMRVSATGGLPEPVTTLGDGELTHRWPDALPGGRAVLYTASTQNNFYEDARVVAENLTTGERKTLHQGGYYARYVTSGHIVWISQGTLFAAPFDLDRLETTGPPVPVLEGVSSAPTSAGAQFSISRRGTLVYVPGGLVGGGAPIHWVTSGGPPALLREMPTNWSDLRFSPDGRQLAMDINNAGNDLWVYDLEREVLSRLTFDPGGDTNPVWTPDGRRIAFRSQRGGREDLYWQRADGTGEAQQLTQSSNQPFPGAFHPNGRVLVFSEASPQTGNDLMLLPFQGDEVSGWTPGAPTVFLQTPFNEVNPRFSPDGRWVAYASNETGRSEVYVRPFEGAGGKWQISTGGGLDPLWSPSKTELFFRSASDNRIMVVGYTTSGESFQPGLPRVWSDTPVVVRPRQGSFDLHPDGQRFAAAVEQATVTGGGVREVVLAFDFLDELERRVSAR